MLRKALHDTESQTDLLYHPQLGSLGGEVMVMNSINGVTRGGLSIFVCWHNQVRPLREQTLGELLYYISYLIGPTSSDTQEWIIKPQRVDYHL